MKHRKNEVKIGEIKEKLKISTLLISLASEDLNLQCNITKANLDIFCFISHQCHIFEYVKKIF